MSKISPKFYGEIKSGKLVFSDPVTLSVYLGCFKEGTEVEIAIRRKIKKRSNQQNAYYWGVVIKLLKKNFGYTKDEMHSALKQEFLKVHPEGKPLYIKHTSQLTTIEFERYIEDVKRWAATEWDTYIPDVDTVIVWE